MGKKVGGGRVESFGILRKVRQGQTSMKALSAMGAAAASVARFVFDCLTIQP